MHSILVIRIDSYVVGELDASNSVKQQSSVATIQICRLHNLMFVWQPVESVMDPVYSQPHWSVHSCGYHHAWVFCTGMTTLILNFSHHILGFIVIKKSLKILIHLYTVIKLVHSGQWAILTGGGLYCRNKGITS